MSNTIQFHGQLERSVLPPLDEDKSLGSRQSGELNEDFDYLSSRASASLRSLGVDAFQMREHEKVNHHKIQNHPAVNALRAARAEASTAANVPATENIVEEETTHDSFEDDNKNIFHTHISSDDEDDDLGCLRTSFAVSPSIALFRERQASQSLSHGSFSDSGPGGSTSDMDNIPTRPARQSLSSRTNPTVRINIHATRSGDQSEYTPRSTPIHANGNSHASTPISPQKSTPTHQKHQRTSSSSSLGLVWADNTNPSTPMNTNTNVNMNTTSSSPLGNKQDSSPTPNATPVQRKMRRRASIVDAVDVGADQVDESYQDKPSTSNGSKYGTPGYRGFLCSEELVNRYPHFPLAYALLPDGGLPYLIHSAKETFADENIRMWESVHRYRCSVLDPSIPLDDTARSAEDIWELHIKNGADQEATMDDGTKRSTKLSLEQQLAAQVLTVDLFDQASIEVFKVIKKDMHPRFLKSTHYRKLVTDHLKALRLHRTKTNTLPFIPEVYTNPFICMLLHQYITNELEHVFHTEKVRSLGPQYRIRPNHYVPIAGVDSTNISSSNNNPNSNVSGQFGSYTPNSSNTHINSTQHPSPGHSNHSGQDTSSISDNSSSNSTHDLYTPSSPSPNSARDQSSANAGTASGQNSQGYYYANLLPKDWDFTRMDNIPPPIVAAFDGLFEEDNPILLPLIHGFPMQSMTEEDYNTLLVAKHILEFSFAIDEAKTKEISPLGLYSALARFTPLLPQSRQSILSQTFLDMRPTYRARAIKTTGGVDITACGLNKIAASSDTFSDSAAAVASSGTTTTTTTTTNSSTSVTTVHVTVNKDVTQDKTKLATTGLGSHIQVKRNIAGGGSKGSLRPISESSTSAIILTQQSTSGDKAGTISSVSGSGSETGQSSDHEGGNNSRIVSPGLRIDTKDANANANADTNASTPIVSTPSQYTQFNPFTPASPSLATPVSANSVTSSTSTSASTSSTAALCSLPVSLAVEGEDDDEPTVRNKSLFSATLNSFFKTRRRPAEATEIPEPSYAKAITPEVVQLIVEALDLSPHGMIFSQFLAELDALAGLDPDEIISQDRASVLFDHLRTLTLRSLDRVYRMWSRTTQHRQLLDDLKNITNTIIGNTAARKKLVAQSHLSQQNSSGSIRPRGGQQQIQQRPQRGASIDNTADLDNENPFMRWGIKNRPTSTSISGNNGGLGNNNALNTSFTSTHDISKTTISDSDYSNSDAHSRTTFPENSSNHNSMTTGGDIRGDSEQDVNSRRDDDSMHAHPQIHPAAQSIRLRTAVTQTTTSTSGLNPNSKANDNSKQDDPSLPILNLVGTVRTKHQRRASATGVTYASQDPTTMAAITSYINEASQAQDDKEKVEKVDKEKQMVKDNTALDNTKNTENSTTTATTTTSSSLPSTSSTSTPAKTPSTAVEMTSRPKSNVSDNTDMSEKPTRPVSHSSAGVSVLVSEDSPSASSQSKQQQQQRTQSAAQTQPAADCVSCCCCCFDCELATATLTISSTNTTSCRKG